ncbi:MAG: Rrf2 family transcriptional regulator [Deltaproteobacteria bacterium]|nr:Rrf2 family transcriptional regulator [Deltaproteobacteria bacterium]
MLSGILAISDAAALALHTAGLLAADPGRRRPARDLAAALGVSQAHLAKVLQRLAHAGLVHSVRGPAGGFVLRRAPDEVALLEVYEAVAGPLRPSPCLLGRPVCHARGCVMGDLLRRIDAEFRTYLASTRLSALAALRLDVSAIRSSRKSSGRVVAPEQQVRRGRTGR